MKNKLTASVLVIGAMLIGGAVYADEDSKTNQPMTYMKDSAITTKIKAKLAKDQQLSTLKNIEVDTDNHGVVILSGYANTQAQADEANAIAKSTDGVSSVKNHIKVQTGN